MKQTFMSLLKFNIIVGVPLSTFALVLGDSIAGYRPNPFATGTFLLGLCYLIFGNISILIKNRKKMANSIKEAALNSAASAIQFKEEAAERAKKIE